MSAFKLVVELMVIILLAYTALYTIEPATAQGLLNAVLGQQASTVTTTMTIPYSSVTNLYVNESLKSYSYTISNDTVMHIMGNNNKVTTIMTQSDSINILYMNITGYGDSIKASDGFVVLNVWGTGDTITVSNATILSLKLHAQNDYVYNETPNGTTVVGHT